MGHPSNVKITKGERFGRLLFTGNKKNEDRRWLGEFLCDFCHKTTFIRIDKVKRERKEGYSCGCRAYNGKWKAKQQTKDYCFHVLWNRVRKRARAHSIPFQLTIQDLKTQFEKQDGKCFYTGLSLSLPKNFLVLTEPLIASVDRIDHKQPYIVGNIHFEYKPVNFMKYTMSSKELIDTARLISSNYAA